MREGFIVDDVVSVLELEMVLSESETQVALIPIRIVKLKLIRAGRGFPENSSKIMSAD
jgi:hypothetical protein